MTMPAADMSKLPTAEKLRLVAALWDSIEADAEITLTDEQWSEINRRMRATDADPAGLVPEHEMRRRLGLSP